MEGKKQMVKNIYIDTYGRSHIASSILSIGSQGVVYRTEDPDIVLKLEWNPITHEIVKDTRDNARFNRMRILPLIPETNLTLPESTLKDATGYTIRLLDGMKSFEDVFSSEGKEKPDNEWLTNIGKVDFNLENQFKQYISSGGIKKRLYAYLKAAGVLAKIHASGLVYGNISDRNMFISSEMNKPDVWLVGCDNLDYMKNTFKKGACYTPGFGSPEAYCEKGNTMYSDSYAFAIALFWTLTTKHPFMGNAVEEALKGDFLDYLQEDFACSGNFAWIGDPTDDSNISDIGLPYNMFIGKLLLECFTNTFGQLGKSNRYKRTIMPEWTYNLAKELDYTVKCRHCKMDYYANQDLVCPWCDSKNQLITVNSKQLIKNRQVEQWNFIGEIKEEGVDIPLRILEGFCYEHIDDTAFQLKYECEEIEISNLSTQYSFYSIGIEDKKEIYGSTRFSCMSNIVIQAIHKKNSICYLIEIGVL